LATNVRSISSWNAELQEMRDAFNKILALVKRINSREVMAERRGRGDRPTDAPSAQVSKDELRRRVGLIAGQPASHNE
jgi:hypothetical protein